MADTLEEAHQAALERVNALIAEGGYDQELSLEALDDQAGDSSYDVAYVLCAYSVSMEHWCQRGGYGFQVGDSGRQAVPRHL